MRHLRYKKVRKNRDPHFEYPVYVISKVPSPVTLLYTMPESQMRSVLSVYVTTYHKPLRPEMEKSSASFESNAPHVARPRGSGVSHSENQRQKCFYRLFVGFPFFIVDFLCMNSVHCVLVAMSFGKKKHSNLINLKYL